jgi:eukaryotic-like serine/threonine-protein kinase
MSDELATLNESRGIIAPGEESHASPMRLPRGVPEQHHVTDADVQGAVWNSCNDRQPDAQPPRIGAYLVLALSGSDEQAQNFRVLHPELGREFFLKLYRDGVTDIPTARERLRQERRLVVECRHPNLLAIVDVDLHEGHPFVVTERVHGLSLTEYARQRRPGAREAAGLVVELARAVDYLHARGIIHQDLTQSNVLIDETGRPKLLDFGLARLRAAWSVDPDNSKERSTTEPSHRLVKGPVEPVGPATDVLGLGTVLKHVLTGQPVESITLGAPLLQREFGKEELPFRAVCPRVPRPLQRICEKAMAPDQNRRYQTAAALGWALWRYRCRRWCALTASVILTALAARFLAGS